MATAKPAHHGPAYSVLYTTNTKETHMDANQAVTDIYAHLDTLYIHRDDEELFYVCVNLKAWLNRGGFVPAGFESKEACLTWLADIMRGARNRAFAYLDRE